MSSTSPPRLPVLPFFALTFAWTWSMWWGAVAAPLPPVREYFPDLEAPHKGLVVFEESAHLPCLAEIAPDRFVAEVVRAAARK